MEDLNIFGRKATWEESVLEAIGKCGGKAVKLQDIYFQVVQHPIVTPYHKEPYKDGGQERYKQWTSKALSTLVKENKVCRVAPAMYSLANKDG